jgi:hypothetical protein
MTIRDLIEWEGELCGCGEHVEFVLRGRIKLNETVEFFGFDAIGLLGVTFMTFVRMVAVVEAGILRQAHQHLEATEALRRML